MVNLAERRVCKFRRVASGRRPLRISRTILPRPLFPTTPPSSQRVRPARAYLLSITENAQAARMHNYLSCRGDVRERDPVYGQTKHHKHSYYLIKSSHRNHSTSSTFELVTPRRSMARYHRKVHASQKHLGFSQLSPANQDVVRKLSSLLRVADALEFSRRHGVESVSWREFETSHHLHRRSGQRQR